MLVCWFTFLIGMHILVLPKHAGTAYALELPANMYSSTNSASTATVHQLPHQQPGVSSIPPQQQVDTPSNQQYHQQHQQQSQLHVELSRPLIADDTRRRHRWLLAQADAEGGYMWSGCKASVILWSRQPYVPIPRCPICRMYSVTSTSQDPGSATYCNMFTCRLHLTVVFFMVCSGDLPNP